MSADHNGLEILSYDECMALLAATRFGRISVTDGALPSIVPVGFAVDGSSIVFRSHDGTKLRAIRGGQVIALQADSIDPELGIGWSVLVVGHARELVDVGDVVRAERLPIPVWLPVAGPHFVRLSASFVSGRRIVGADGDVLIPKQAEGLFAG